MTKEKRKTGETRSLQPRVESGEKKGVDRRDGRSQRAPLLAGLQSVFARPPVKALR
jgi:hypothetical protein